MTLLYPLAVRVLMKALQAAFSAAVSLENEYLWYTAETGWIYEGVNEG